MNPLRAFIATSLLSTLVLGGCSNPQPGPDKTVGGTVLGAAWGAGTGAIVGNQIGHRGQGAGVGAGLGAAAGMMTGGAMDYTEGALVDQKRQMQGLAIQNRANRQHLANVQDALDHAAAQGVTSRYQLFFDTDATSLRVGSVAALEGYAESLRRDPRVTVITVEGHADDSGTPDYNQRLAEARARTVASYLAGRGISMDQIQIQSYGSTRPVATNSTPMGRQMNRRVEIATQAR